jgi:CRP-like cAMP-binding protein
MKDPMTSPVSNLLIASLPPAYRQSLLSRLKPVALSLKELLYENDTPPKFGHFITSGIASVVSSMANGATAEVGIWGKEGLVQSFHLLGNAKVPNRCFMQVTGTALQIPFKDIQKEFQDVPEFRDCVLQCVQSHGFILSQLAACNRLHEAEERLARWLLMVRDRMESETFYITQDILATMLGARRTTVTAAASTLQRKGFIKYSRGRIQIVDPTSLEGAACECYPTIRSLYMNFYSQTSVV